MCVKSQRFIGNFKYTSTYEVKVFASTHERAKRGGNVFVEVQSWQIGKADNGREGLPDFPVGLVNIEFCRQVNIYLFDNNLQIIKNCSINYDLNSKFGTGKCQESSGELCGSCSWD